MNHVDVPLMMSRKWIGIDIWIQILEGQDVVVDNLLYFYLKSHAVFYVMSRCPLVKNSSGLGLIPPRWGDRSSRKSS